MSNDSFTEVTSQSWFSRLGNTFKGIIFGFILVVISFPLLFWNEGRAVKRYKALNEGGGAVISVAADRVDQVNHGKLVHLTGMAATDETLTDSVFGVARQAIKLMRSVEMYQWEQKSQSQEKKKLGGGTETTTTYTYNKTWSANVVKSGNFKVPQGHENPGQMPYSSEKMLAETVTIGAFSMPPSLIGKINVYSPVMLDNDFKLPDTLSGKAQVTSNTVYIGSDPATPQIGDVRVSFKEVKPMVVSLVANQMNNTFEPYNAKSGGTVELLVTGDQSAEAMFEQAQKSNTFLTWILRGIGYVLMALGFSLILAPLSVFADVVPFIGSIVGAGTGFIAALTAGFLSFITIGIAWFVYRPMLGIILLIFAGGIGFFAFSRIRKATPAGAEATLPPESDG